MLSIFWRTVLIRSIAIVVFVITILYFCYRLNYTIKIYSFSLKCIASRFNHGLYK